jgi:hypothetical protein
MHVLHSHLPTKTSQMTTAYESPSQHTSLFTAPATSHAHPTLSGAAEAFVSIFVPSVQPFQPVSIPALPPAPTESSGGSGVGQYGVYIATGSLIGFILVVVGLSRICVWDLRRKKRARVLIGGRQQAGTSQSEAPQMEEPEPSRLATRRLYLWYLRRKKRTQFPIGGQQQAGTSQNETPQMEEPEPIRLAPRRREQSADDEIEEQGQRNQVEGYDASPIEELGGIAPRSNLAVPINPNETRVLLLDPRTNDRPLCVMSGQTLVAVPRSVSNAGEHHLILTVVSRSPNLLQILIIS